MSRVFQHKLSQSRDISIWNRRDVFAGARIYMSVASATAIARTRPTEASRSILGRTYLRTPSLGPLSAVLVHRSGVQLQQRSPAPRLIPGERRGVCHQELWGQIGPMGSGGRRGSRRPRRTVRADDTDGKVGDSLEATRERSPTVSSPGAPLPRVGSLGRRVVRSVWWEKRRRGRRRGDPASGDADTRPFSRGGATERRFAGDPLLSCLLLHDPAGGACGIWWYRYDIARLTQGDCCRPATRTSAGTALVHSGEMRCVMCRMVVAKLEIRDKGV